MNAWLQLLPKLKPGARVVIQHVHGAKFQDTICNDESAFGPAYFSCCNGTFSMRNGWHVLGERRIIEVLDDKPKAPHVASPREKLIASMAKKRPSTAPIDAG